jgi:hypothetical protein
MPDTAFLFIYHPVNGTGARPYRGILGAGQYLRLVSVLVPCAFPLHPSDGRVENQILTS